MFQNDIKTSRYGVYPGISMGGLSFTFELKEISEETQVWNMFNLYPGILM